jgi:hypothetical protein
VGRQPDRERWFVLPWFKFWVSKLIYGKGINDFWDYCNKNCHFFVSTQKSLFMVIDKVDSRTPLPAFTYFSPDEMDDIPPAVASTIEYYYRPAQP